MCQVVVAKLSQGLTDVILQTPGKVRAASVCSQGAGQASLNCPLLKPVRTIIFKLGRLELHYSYWGMNRWGNV